MLELANIADGADAVVKDDSFVEELLGVLRVVGFESFGLSFEEVGFVGWLVLHSECVY